ncbi:MAG: transketolase [Bacillota bacterium]
MQGLDLVELAAEMRQQIVEMIVRAGSGHPGGSLSVADILTVLFFRTMRLDPEHPDWPERDRLVLSKGHAAPALYAALAMRGYFPVDELATLRQLGSRLQGHPDMKKLPGVEMSTGSLGQGLSAANGMALGLRLQGSDSHVFVIMGDGEMQEGQIWEAAMTAAHYQLDNVIGIVDHNRLQIDGPVQSVMGVEPLAEKWRSFGWHVVELDGHDLAALAEAFEEAKARRGQPTLILAQTIKGKGFAFMENKAEWHGKAPSSEQVAAELERKAGV